MESKAIIGIVIVVAITVAIVIMQIKRMQELHFIQEITVKYMNFCMTRI